jgi:hypothetical protein
MSVTALLINPALRRAQAEGSRPESAGFALSANAQIDYCPERDSLSVFRLARAMVIKMTIAGNPSPHGHVDQKALSHRSVVYLRARCTWFCLFFDGNPACRIWRQRRQHAASELGWGNFRWKHGWFDRRPRRCDRIRR